MKLKPLFTLVLFVASAGILVWIYFAATRERPKTDPKTTLRAETLTDLDACSRRKHVKAAQYDHFAKIARDNQQDDAARLFNAMAFAARLQEGNCANAIVRLGGHYTPPTKVVVFQGATDDNLARSITFERQGLNELHGADIDRAMKGGNRYAARILIWAASGDLKNIVLMERSRLGRKIPGAITPGYVVCPLCGNIYAEDYQTPYCPQCMTDGRQFVKFEE